MASPSAWRRTRPLSSSGYEPLAYTEKPKPPPKPKPPFLKAFSATAITSSCTDNTETSQSRDKDTATGYFQPSGATGIGYCLSSVYKTTRTSSEYGDKSDEGVAPPKLQDSKLKFVSKDSSRPPITSLPAKFRLSFEDRNRLSVCESDATPEPVAGTVLAAISEYQTPTPPSPKNSKHQRSNLLPVTVSPYDEPVPDILVAVSESGTDVIRRKPPLILKNSKNRMSNPLPLSVNSSVLGVVALSESDTHVLRRTPPPVPKNDKNRMSNPLPATTNPSKSPVNKCTKSKTPSLNRDSSFSTAQTSNASPTSSPATPSSFNPARPVTFAQPPPHEMEYVEREHPHSVFEYLDKFRHKGELCDATLLVHGTELKAHRVVLAACSQFFESMFIGEFAEPAEEPVIIEELSDDVLESMIAFAYTSRIKLNDKNIYSVFEAADLLQFNGVKGACFKFFKQQINKSNCIRTWLFAESNNCIELLDASLKYIDYNFLDIVRGREFLDIDQPDIVNSITSREDLSITSEEQVYEAVLSWVQSKPEKRKNHALRVFKNVRFPSMSKDYLMHIVDNEPLIKEDPDLLQLLIDALESHVTNMSMRGTLRKQRSKSMDPSSMMRPRAASMAVEVVNICRLNALLGLRVMGGVDRPQHVFRQGDKSGVFILHILEGSPASKVGKLRAGDRILQVNGTDMTKVKHDEAIRVLKMCSDPLSFLVRHEPAPVGLKEITLVTKQGEGFGLVITGGVSSYSGNPMDDTDEGIFISQIIPGGAAEQDSRLKVGTRILQVNSISMLGKTHNDALKVLQGILDRLNLLVCNGYDPSAIGQMLDEDDLTCLENDAFL